MSAYCDTREITIWGVSARAIERIPDPDRVTAIEAASAVIDSYIRSQVTLPLTDWGSDLRRACAIIAAYDLVQSRGLAPNTDGDDGLRTRYLDVIGWLKLIASGTVTADVTGSGDSSTAGGIGSPQVLSNVSRGWQDLTGAGAGKFSGGRR